jgi:hypothetical protein
VCVAKLSTAMKIGDLAKVIFRQHGAFALVR